jgi:hypothetical protein
MEWCCDHPVCLKWRSLKNANVLFRVGIPTQTFHDPLSPFINPGQALEPPSQEKVRPGFLARHLTPRCLLTNPKADREDAPRLVWLVFCLGDSLT